MRAPLLLQKGIGPKLAIGKKRNVIRDNPVNWTVALADNGHDIYKANCGG